MKALVHLDPKPGVRFFLSQHFPKHPVYTQVYISWKFAFHKGKGTHRRIRFPFVFARPIPINHCVCAVDRPKACAAAAAAVQN